MSNNSEYIIRLIREKVKETDPNAEIILYGSRARGDAREFSDWDILILTNYPITYKDEQKFRHNLYDIEVETGEIISTFVYFKNEWNSKHKVTPLYYNISKEGIRL